MARRKRVWKVKVVERKLGREKAWGLHEPGDLRALAKVELDPRMPARRWLTISIHELLHEACPEWTHKRVYRVAGLMARTLWAARWRRVMK